MNRAAVAILGSLNMDFVVSVDTLPAPGQTVLGSHFQMAPGGKGANQACACGRLAHGSLTVRMVGRVGYDLFADHLKASLSAAGVDVSAVHSTRSQPTGIATISVDRTGQNAIVVAPGANHALSPTEVEAWRPSFRGAAFALFQLETPLAVVAAASRLAKQEGARTILDPAPAQPLSSDLLSAIDILTPNETETCVLLGRDPSRVTPDAAPELGRALRVHTGVPAVLLKLGDHGCFWSDGVQDQYAPGFSVQAVDATAAGDTFNGAFAVALAEGRPLAEALRFANAAAALSVTVAGAQSSIPARAQVDSLLRG